MKLIKYFTPIIVFLFILFLSYNLYSLSTGFTGSTKKTDGVGCICHGNFEADSTVSVTITGPDSLMTGQTGIYKLIIKGGPHITGGFNVASDSGSIDTVAIDTGVQKILNELTHIGPKQFTGDSVTWLFKYTAPAGALHDTLFSTGNSTNNDGFADTIDAWNFGINKPIKIYEPIGIINQNEIAKSFKLYQNYPNPFNPTTTIQYSIPYGNRAVLVILKIYDISGKFVEKIVYGMQNSGEYKIIFNGDKYSSGIYFYELNIINGSENHKQIRKMVLIK